ncbi:MAG TPA: hypothetical protein VH370_09335 [Humisphaera sp.]|jgi:hypothetical protein|nr:hypothetical protein [Humisphaera sp.]
MPEEQDLEPRDDELIQALAGLQLAPANRPVRDIWYQAGVARGRRQTTVWRAISLCTMAAIAGLLLRGNQSSPSVVPSAYVHQSPPRPVAPVAAREQKPVPVFSAINMRLRDAVLEHGLEALPPSIDGGDEPAMRAAASNGI